MICNRNIFRSIHKPILRVFLCPAFRRDLCHACVITGIQKSLQVFIIYLRIIVHIINCICLSDLQRISICRQRKLYHPCGSILREGLCLWIHHKTLQRNIVPIFLSLIQNYLFIFPADLYKLSRYIRECDLRLLIPSFSVRRIFCLFTAACQQRQSKQKKYRKLSAFSLHNILSFSLIGFPILSCPS